jgi:hypothetical protein
VLSRSNPANLQNKGPPLPHALTQKNVKPPPDESDEECTSSSSDGCERKCLAKHQKTVLKQCHKDKTVESGVCQYLKYDGQLMEMATPERMPYPGRLRQVRLLIDSRDRDRNAFQNANNFEVQWSHKPKLILNVELAAAQIPLLFGMAERYVVVTEDHCEDVLSISDSAMFGVPTNPAGCNYPHGIVAMIPFHKLWNAAGTDNFIWWQNGMLREVWSTPKQQGVNSSFDRLHIRTWTWSATTAGVLYPLPVEPLPGLTDPANNVVYVFILTCEF